ncbi:MAG: endonuclease domain-containing protein [Gordonia sp. (in: high G+C Gram-positive bacteria)]|jgi:very-short-patch-repair endonuclease|nr:endonuclease domain-containing protein [Gordonia sp. (in: high G+C Gram-positive bacteria)]
MDSGVFRRGKLLDRMPRAAVDRAIADGSLTQIRHGWLATPTAHPDAVRAVQAGGVLTCSSALRLHGVWTPPTMKFHVRGIGRGRTHPTWCRQHGVQPPADDAVDDLPTALRHAARCLPSEDFVVVCDSVLNRRLMTPSALEAEFGGAPRSVYRALAAVDGRAESGTETMVRLRLRAPNRSIRPQVRIPGVGRVDLVVGRSLIIEVDGAAYHVDPVQFEKDRLRDLTAWTLGYRPIRLTYQQVVYQWDEIGPLLLQIIRRGDHLKPLIAS